MSWREFTIGRIFSTSDDCDDTSSWLLGKLFWSASLCLWVGFCSWHRTFLLWNTRNRFGPAGAAQILGSCDGVAWAVLCQLRGRLFGGAEMDWGEWKHFKAVSSPKFRHLKKKINLINYSVKSGKICVCVDFFILKLRYITHNSLRLLEYSDLKVKFPLHLDVAWVSSCLKVSVCRIHTDLTPVHCAHQSEHFSFLQIPALSISTDTRYRSNPIVSLITCVFDLNIGKTSQSNFWLQIVQIKFTICLRLFWFEG